MPLREPQPREAQQPVPAAEAPPLQRKETQEVSAPPPQPKAKEAIKEVGQKELSVGRATRKRLPLSRTISPVRPKPTSRRPQITARESIQTLPLLRKEAKEVELPPSSALPPDEDPLSALFGWPAPAARPAPQPSFAEKMTLHTARWTPPATAARKATAEAKKKPEPPRPKLPLPPKPARQKPPAAAAVVQRQPMTGLPVPGSPAPPAVQRQETEETGGREEKKTNYRKLAEKVYPYVKRLINVERERMG
jgi:hypothetical protein